MFGFAGGESPQTVARKNLDQSGCAIAQAKRQHPANRAIYDATHGSENRLRRFTRSCAVAYNV